MLLDITADCMCWWMGWRCIFLKKCSSASKNLQLLESSWHMTYSNEQHYLNLIVWLQLC